MAKAFREEGGRFLAAGLSNVFMSLDLLKYVLKTAYDCTLDCVIHLEKIKYVFSAGRH